MDVIIRTEAYLFKRFAISSHINALNVTNCSRDLYTHVILTAIVKIDLEFAYTTFNKELEIVELQSANYRM